MLGINPVFHDPAAAVAVDGKAAAAAEEERFSRRKRGKRLVPFSGRELPGLAARGCLAESGIGVGDLDAIAYSYDASLVRPGQDGLDRGWEALRTSCADRAGVPGHRPAGAGPRQGHQGHSPRRARRARHVGRAGQAARSAALDRYRSPASSVTGTGLSGR